MVQEHTVKAPNFELHVNFGLFFQKGLPSLKHDLKKNEESEGCRRTSDLKTWFCSFLEHNSYEEAMKHTRNSPKFP
jgi:hypothetical protein